jgi:hypothetical protein
MLAFECKIRLSSDKEKYSFYSGVSKCLVVYDVTSENNYVIVVEIVRGNQYVKGKRENLFSRKAKVLGTGS